MSLALSDQTADRSRSLQGLIPQLIIISQRRHVHSLTILARFLPPLFFFSNQDTTIQHPITVETLAPFNHLQSLRHFCTNGTISPWHFLPWGLQNKSRFLFSLIVPAGANYLFWVGGKAKTYKKKNSIKLRQKASASCCIFARLKRHSFNHSIKWWIKGAIRGLLPHGKRQVASSAWIKICARLAETGRWALPQMNFNPSNEFQFVLKVRWAVRVSCTMRL